MLVLFRSFYFLRRDLVKHPPVGLKLPLWPELTRNQWQSSASAPSRAAVTRLHHESPSFKQASSFASNSPAGYVGAKVLELYKGSKR